MSRSHHEGDRKSERDRKSDRKSEGKGSSSRRECGESPREESREERHLRKDKEFAEREKRHKSRRRSRSPKEDRSRKRHRKEEDTGFREDRKPSRKRRPKGDPVSKDDSESEDSRRDRKKRSSKEKDRKQKHKKNEHQHSRKKDKKESKKDKGSKKDKKSDPKPKMVAKPDKSKLFALGSPPEKPPNKLLDVQEDYFAFHQPLWVWLYREEGVAFNDLTSDESRDAFARFVKQYNAGQLEAAYYDEKGLPFQAIEECKTTRHKWNFQTSETERKGLQMLQDGVRKLTEYTDENKKPTIDKETPRGPNVTHAVAPRATNEINEDGDDDHRRGAWNAEERMAHRVANRRLRDHVRTAEEELGGGRADYGRERQLEKKKETAAKIHGAARDRDDVGITISDDALYGDGGHGASFQMALERERKRKAQREESKHARIKELQEKEKSKQQAMLDMLGLAGVAPGQKIKIAPRQDGN